jgi:hypothetical protein
MVRNTLCIRNIAHTSMSDVFRTLRHHSHRRRVARVNARIPEREAGQLLRARDVYDRVVSGLVGHEIELVWADMGAVAAWQKGDLSAALVVAHAEAESSPVVWLAAREDFGAPRYAPAEACVGRPGACARGTWRRSLEFGSIGASELVADGRACVGTRFAATERNIAYAAPCHRVCARIGSPRLDSATTCAQLRNRGDVAVTGYRGV